tara:strand:- start:734 stop:970 length:237 start_codon:yes stop_codon:yes gene_type:complete
MLLYNPKKNEQRWFEELTSNRGVVVLKGDNVELGRDKGLWVDKTNKTVEASHVALQRMSKTFFVIHTSVDGLVLKEKE